MCHRHFPSLCVRVQTVAVNILCVLEDYLNEDGKLLPWHALRDMRYGKTLLTAHVIPPHTIPKPGHKKNAGRIGYVWEDSGVGRMIPRGIIQANWTSKKAIILECPWCLFSRLGKALSSK